MHCQYKLILHRQLIRIFQPSTSYKNSGVKWVMCKNPNGAINSKKNYILTLTLCYTVLYEMGPYIYCKMIMPFTSQRLLLLFLPSLLVKKTILHP
jgi:hypothetical protein